MYRAAGADCCCELKASCSESKLLVWRAAVSTSCCVAGAVVGLDVVVIRIRGVTLQVPSLDPILVSDPWLWLDGLQSQFTIVFDLQWNEAAGCAG